MAIAMPVQLFLNQWDTFLESLMRLARWKASHRSSAQPLVALLESATTELQARSGGRADGKTLSMEVGKRLQ